MDGLSRPVGGKRSREEGTSGVKKKVRFSGLSSVEAADLVKEPPRKTRCLQDAIDDDDFVSVPARKSPRLIPVSEPTITQTKRKTLKSNEKKKSSRKAGEKDPSVELIPSDHNEPVFPVHTPASEGGDAARGNEAVSEEHRECLEREPLNHEATERVNQEDKGDEEFYNSLEPIINPEDGEHIGHGDNGSSHAPAGEHTMELPSPPHIVGATQVCVGQVQGEVHADGPDVHKPVATDGDIEGDVEGMSDEGRSNELIEVIDSQAPSKLAVNEEENVGEMGVSNVATEVTEEEQGLGGKDITGNVQEEEVIGDEQGPALKACSNVVAEGVNKLTHVEENVTGDEHGVGEKEMPSTGEKQGPPVKARSNDVAEGVDKLVGVEGKGDGEEQDDAHRDNSSVLADSVRDKGTEDDQNVLILPQEEHEEPAKRVRKLLKHLKSPYKVSPLFKKWRSTKMIRVV